MLDSVVTKDIERGEPMKGAHRKFVAVSLVGSELPTKVVERVEGVLIVETFLVFPMAAFHLAVVAWGVRTDQFVADAQLPQSIFKKSRSVAVGREPVGELQSIIGLNTFHLNAFSGEFQNDLFQEIR